MIDDYTKRHLLAWIESQYRDDDDQRAAFDTLLAVYASDPEYYGARSWPEIRDAVRASNPSLCL